MVLPISVSNSNDPSEHSPTETFDLKRINRDCLRFSKF